VALKRFVAFTKSGNVQEKYIYRLCNVEQLEKDFKSHLIKYMKNDVFYYKSDMHVRPMRFSILCTPTESSDKTQLMY